MSEELQLPLRTAINSEVPKTSQVRNPELPIATARAASFCDHAGTPSRGAEATSALMLW
jgi:hypothetical protein